MKMYLMTFDEACEAFDKECHTKINSVKNSVFGIGKDSIPWGENVEVDIETLNNSNNLSTYELNGFFVPTCMFKINNKSLDKNPIVNDILRYGTILTDDELFNNYDEMADYIRIKIMSYKQAVYYIKKVNGEAVEFKKVGIVG